MASADVVESQVGEDGVILFGDVPLLGEVVFVLDQKPVVFAAFRLDERPGAFQLVAAEEHRDLAVVDVLSHALIRLVSIVERELAAVIGRIRTGIPNDDFSGAIFTFRNHALEGSVVQRVVLDHDG